MFEIQLGNNIPKLYYINVGNFNANSLIKTLTDF